MNVLLKQRPCGALSFIVRPPRDVEGYWLAGGCCCIFSNAWLSPTTWSNLRIAVGDGGITKLLRAMRVHSNFAEYIPFAQFLICQSEAQGAKMYLWFSYALLR